MAQPHHCQHLIWATQQAGVVEGYTLDVHPFHVPTWIIDTLLYDEEELWYNIPETTQALNSQLTVSIQFDNMLSSVADDYNTDRLSFAHIE